MDSTAASHVGAPSAYAALGPPDKMIPVGSNFWISLIFDVHGSTAENTCCSRTRRAISCVYCPPKSITTTPPNSDFGLCTSSFICAPLAISSPSLKNYPRLKADRRPQHHSKTRKGAARCAQSHESQEFVQSDSVFFLHRYFITSLLHYFASLISPRPSAYSASPRYLFLSTFNCSTVNSLHFTTRFTSLFGNTICFTT